MEETKKQGTSKLIPFLKGTIAFLLVSLSLFSVFFDEYSKEYLVHKSTYKSVVKKRDSINKSVILNHNKKLLLAFPNDKKIQALTDNLLLEYDKGFLEGRSYLKEYTAKKKLLANNHSFLGRSSFHFWIVYFGLITGLLYFSIKSLKDSFSRGSTFRHQFLDIIGVIVSIFWGIHSIFLTQDDFVKNKYILTLSVCSVLGGVFVYFITRYYTYKDVTISNLLSFISRVKEDHYPKVAVKAMYSEKTGEVLETSESVEDNADKFDKDLVQTINGI